MLVFLCWFWLSFKVAFEWPPPIASSTGHKSHRNIGRLSATLNDSQRLSTKQNKGICSMRATPLLALFLNQGKCLVFTTKSILHFLSPKTMYCFLRLQSWYYFGLAQMGFPSVWEEQLGGRKVAPLCPRQCPHKSAPPSNSGKTKCHSNRFTKSLCHSDTFSISNQSSRPAVKNIVSLQQQHWNQWTQPGKFWTGVSGSPNKVNRDDKYGVYWVHWSVQRARPLPHSSPCTLELHIIQLLHWGQAWKQLVVETILSLQKYLEILSFRVSK